jgi:hypothetical protein
VRPARRSPSAPTSASKRNRRESAVVDWLIDRLAVRLGDRTCERHGPPWEPRQNVLLGVLEPTRVQAPAPTSGVSADAVAAAKSEIETVSKPVSDVPTLGLVFRVEAGQAANLTLSVDACFALYLEEVASLIEQRTYLGDGGDISVPVQAGAITPVEEVEAALPTAPPRGKTQRVQKTRLLGAWQRHDAVVPTLQMVVPLNGDVVTLSEPLHEVAATLIEVHYRRADAMRPFSGKRNEIPRASLKNEATFAAAAREALDRDWQPSIPELLLTAFAQPLGHGEYLVSVSLRNATEISERSVQDLAAYDCSLAVRVEGSAQILHQQFDLAPDDYRLENEADVIGQGTACVAVASEDGGVRTETLPTHIQAVVVPRADHVDAPVWSALAQDPTSILRSVEEAMQEYEEEFIAFVRAARGQAHEAAAKRELEEFSDELRRFRLGRRAMRIDGHLNHAFRLANEVFALANKSKPFQTWRLFQLVYIVSHLPALAAREHADTEMRAELDFVDVLWFPAGGGKTEAYLGLIVTALFYDRLRGKDAGVTSWLRFPLRMLSVQQLSRMLRVLVIAEDLRVERGIGSSTADPFALGYLVGSGGTPNALKWDTGWWRGWDAERRLAEKGEFIQEHLKDRLVTTCPYCSAERVVLCLDTDAVRIVHSCTACGRQLPLHLTDEEVYRYLPAVVISTVDKLVGYTWFGEYTAFSRGPRYQCPKHGYYSFPNQGTCLVGKDLCPPLKQGHHAQATPIKDPVPALTIQDEMHLLKEELGAFSGHYEGLIAELQRGGPSGLPTKVLAASATIEHYEDQLRQVYGRRPRAFPSPGFERTRTFYTETIPDVRRIFVGVLPHYRRKADVAAIVQAEMLEAVARLEDDSDALATLAIQPDAWERSPTWDDALDLLFDYEVSLGYVNSKAHGAKLDEELRLLSDRLDYEGLGAVERVVLTGQVPIPDLADAIARVEKDNRQQARQSRLRALVGTSVISHGVDLDRLNVLVVAGMPTTAADYIQVTARAGRTHTGIVVTVYDPFSRRERSLFSNFATYHRFLDQMVTPVPVNKYAFFVADRTVPGIALALLHDMSRDPEFSPPLAGVRRSKDFQAWWNSRRSDIDDVMRHRLPRCYETPVAGVNDASMERELADRALARWTDIEAPALSRPPEEKNTTSMFHEPPLSNFRDIDVPADFTPHFRSLEAFEAVTGKRPYTTDNDAADSSDGKE